jgi:hypothetical protein
VIRGDNYDIGTKIVIYAQQTSSLASQIKIALWMLNELVVTDKVTTDSNCLICMYQSVHVSRGIGQSWT